MKRDRPLILLVDDSEFALKATTRAYKCKYDFIPVRNGTDAISAAKIYLPDLILMDVLMPGIDGIETVRQIKCDHEICNIPVIMITSLADSETELKSLQAGASDFVTKPFHCEILKIKIDRLLGYNHDRR